MATREYVVERLNKAQERLAKKQGTLEKHIKAIDKKEAKIVANGWNFWTPAFEARRYAEIPNEVYWLFCEIKDKEEQIENTKEEIEKAEADIAKWSAMLVTIEEKEQSRNVPAITEFLNNWEEEAIEWYTKQQAEFLKARTIYYAQDRELCERGNRCRDGKERAAIREQNWKLTKEFNARWREMIYLNGKGDFDAEMRKMVADEKNRKYDDIINRTNEEVGTITDAAGLKVDGRCNLNGFIIGERGTVKVESIYAGGWNIQCLHIRTLIHKIA